MKCSENILNDLSHVFGDFSKRTKIKTSKSSLNRVLLRHPHTDDVIFYTDIDNKLILNEEINVEEAISGIMSLTERYSAVPKDRIYLTLLYAYSALKMLMDKKPKNEIFIQEALKKCQYIFGDNE